MIIRNSLILILFVGTFMSSMAQGRQSAIVLNTPSGDIYGSLFVPAGDSSTTVAIIIAGSGPTDRDGNQIMMRNNSLLMLSQALACKNIATVRYDKRGIASSRDAAPTENDIRLNDYISDAKGWADKMVRDGRFQKVVFIGHSEGSLIAMSAAASGAKVGGVVSIAGPGRTFDQVLKDQLGEQPPQIRDIAYSIIDSLQQGLKVSRVPFFLVSLFRPSVQNYLISMMRHNPQFEIRKVGVPVLIVQGDADIQVRMEDARLLAAANPHARLRVIAGMNHVLKNCPSIDKQMQMATYINPTIPIDIHLVNEIVKFIKNL